MAQLKKIFSGIEINIASVFYAGMLFLILLSVGMRTFGKGLTWCEELARYFVVWGTCFGIAGGVKSRAHIFIDFIIDRIPAKLSLVVRLFNDIVATTIFAAVFFYGCTFVYMNFKSGQIAPALQQPMWIIYLAFPIGFGFSILRQLFNVKQSFDNLKAGPERAVNEE